jgi:outer membrane receptor for ferrienterochelin and colicin
VISGATSLYGGGSTGGLINIVTKKGQQERRSIWSWAARRLCQQQRS